MDESVGAPVLLVDESVTMTSSAATTVAEPAVVEEEVEEVVELDAKTTKKLAILEKKLSKAENKGDDEAAAKLEKKIAKLNPTSTSTSTTTAEPMESSSTTVATPSVEELLAKIDELEYDAKVRAV